ncbi:MAG: HAD-IC family P-type ATPase [Chloroflexi bacterium]|nr:HAD-IC family P-type ATPase [Chloroflexota bacterium]
MAHNPVTIIKDGNLTNIDTGQLCRGDLVVLQTADIVPADLRLVEANGLEVDEFEITGEIMPVAKTVDDDADIYMGSRITKGMGKGIVVAVGEQTEFGKALQPSEDQNKVRDSPMIEKKYLILVGLLLPAFIVQAVRSDNLIVMAAFYLLLSAVLLLLQNDRFFRRLLISNELRKLEHLDIQLRDAGALERMSHISAICFDKTGVLTTRQMEVKTIYFADKMFDANDTSAVGKGIFDRVKIGCVLCNDVLFFEKLESANPLDKALISYALKNGSDFQDMHLLYKRIYDQPFDSENRYMASGFERDGKKYYFAKGDPEVILKLCKSYMTAAGTQKTAGAEFLNSNLLNLETVNANGDTAIALAYSNVSPENYTFLCLLQLENPLQAGVREIIKDVAERGIRSILLTGDKPETAMRVAEDCGIARGSKIYLTGRTINRMDPVEIARQTAHCSIFARLLPSQKGFLIRLLQQNGDRIAMVGDGVNDGIALRAADIGITFVKDSAPVLRNLAQILIRDLSDLPRLMESSRRMGSRIKQLKFFRFLAAIVLLSGVYAWVLTSGIFGR